MKKLIYPCLLASSFLLPYLGFQKFEHKGIIAFISYLSFLLVVIALERLTPYKHEWNKNHGDIGHDFFWSFFGAFFPIKVIQGMLMFSLAGLTAQLGSYFSTGLWPASLPMVVQVMLCFAIAEFFGYWAHRLRHEVPLLWRFHALHHSPKRLYFLNTSRFHPVDIMIGQLFIFPFMVVMQVPKDVIFWNTILFQNIGLLSHCNIKFEQFWVIRMIFNTDEHHRWHHSKVVKESNSNYAPSLILWDIIFGTFFYRKDHSAPPVLGVTPEYPESLLEQFTEPFINEKWVGTFQAKPSKQEQSP